MAADRRFCAPAHRLSVSNVSTAMPAILCFGDSNTWGYDPDASAVSPVPVRHPAGVRWTGVLAAALGTGWEVVGAGQNGRTTVFEDPHHPGRNGRSALPVFLDTFKPLDLVILMLGTNDLKTIFHAPPGEIAAGAASLIRLIRHSESGPGGTAPRVLLVCPPQAGPFDHLPELSEKFGQGHARSLRLPGAYRPVADQLGCDFLDAQPIVTLSPVDGLHFDAAQHRLLGEAMATAVRGLNLC
jgi:lysophospholipase L1-like esterase